MRTSVPTLSNIQLYYLWEGRAIDCRGKAHETRAPVPWHSLMGGCRRASAENAGFPKKPHLHTRSLRLHVVHEPMESCHQAFCGQLKLKWSASNNWIRRFSEVWFQENNWRLLHTWTKIQSDSEGRQTRRISELPSVRRSLFSSLFSLSYIKQLIILGLQTKTKGNSEWLSYSSTHKVHIY